MNSQPTTVVVGLCTYERPQMLRTYLDSLGAQILPTDIAPWGHYRPRGASALWLNLLGKQIKSRIVRRWLHSLAKLHGPIYDVTRFGVKQRCHTRDNTTEKKVVFGRCGPELGIILERLHSGGTFLDIGANSGTFALAAAKAVGPEGRVLAVEPNPQMLNRLRFNIAANGFRNVVVAPVAVGDEESTAELYLSTKQLGKTSLIAERDWPTITVPVRPLAAICADHSISTIDALKIDVEGFEDRALLPFIRTAPKSLWPRAILIETRGAHRWRDGCLYHLEQAGYRITWRSDTDAMLCLS